MDDKINHCNTCPTHIRGLCCYKKIIIQRSRYEWELRYHTPCKHLNKANRCKIYDKRHEYYHCLDIEEAKSKPFTLPYGCKYLET